MRFLSALIALCLPLLTLAQPCNELNAAFTWTSTPNGVQFSNGSTGTGGSTTWLWSFGDNTGHNMAQPFHTYAQPGTYEVCLTAISVYELPSGEFITCQDTACANIQLGGDPCSELQACFVTNDLGGGTFFFDNCSNGPLGVLFAWDFGDGSTSTVNNAEHHYAAPGTYQVCLYAIWQSCADTTCTSITVHDSNPCDSLNANFTWSGGIDGVNFGNAVITNNWTYFWEFGDGTTDYGPNPYHTFPEAGSYETCLTVWTWDPVAQDTCFEHHCELVSITGGDPCEFLQACFQPSPVGASAYFFNNCTANELGTQFMWDFGDGATSDALAPTHAYTQPGVYTVCLWATWQNCADSTCHTITVGEPDPCIGLDAGFSAFTTPNGTQFANGTIGTGIQTSYFWDFGDGSSSSEAEPFHTYAAPGSYVACLQVLTFFELTGGGLHTCVDSTCNTVVISGGDPCDQLEACFVTNDLGNGTFFFDNCTFGLQGTQFSWDFGDGSQSTMTNVEHHFDEPGNYTICLFAYWENCVDTACTTITVGVDPCDGLVACFEPQPFENGVYHFANCSQTLPINIPEQYTWTFGDGTTSHDAELDHVFDPGTYSVCLIVEQGDCVDSTCTTIMVGGGNPCNDLNAAYSWSGGIGGVNFANTVINNNWTYFWEFGDGTSDYGPSPFHTYPEAGSYETCLTVWTWDPVAQDTCFEHHCELVNVTGGDPCNDIQACYVTNLLPNNGIFLDNCSSGPSNMQFLWTFGDGSSSSVTNAEHHYAQAGTYTACLIAFWQNCSDTTCTTITIIGDDPCGELDAGFAGLSAGLNVNFANNVINTTWSYFWEFGDGTIGDGPNPLHTYPETGSYEVCLTVWTWDPIAQDTCFADHCELVTVAGGDPCAFLHACFGPAANGTTVYFDNCTLHEAGTQYFWDFGDGAISDAVTPTHTYVEPGTYTVCLIAEWQNCLDTLCLQVATGDSLGCAGFTTSFELQATGNTLVFFGQSSIPADGMSWDFGDGTEGYGSQVTHLYEPPGPYEVCLTSWYWNEAMQDSCFAHSCQSIDPFHVGISATESGEPFLLFPQPAHDELTISGVALLKGSVIRLIGMDGRLELQERAAGPVHKLDLSGVTPAVHLLQVELDGRRFNYRVIVE